MEHTQPRVLSENRDDHDSSALFDRFHKGAQAAFHSGDLETDLKSLIGKNLPDGVFQWSVEDIQSFGNATATSDFKPVVTHVGDEHPLCPGSNHCLSDKVAYGSGAGNHYILTPQIPGSCSGVRPHGRRFDHCTVFPRHIIGQTHDPVIIDYKIILRCAIRLKSLDSQIFADIVLPPTTRSAFSANQLRARRYPVSRCTDSDFRADGNDFGGVFVPLNHRIESRRMIPVPRVDFASAYTNPLYFRQHLVRPEVLCLRRRNFPKFNMFRSNQNSLPHNPSFI